jgi:uncharacterized protein YbjT (DUF2867 family)
MSNDVLVLGGTGKTGRRVVHHLRAAGATVRVAARHPGAAGDGVRPVNFDWFDASTHDAALEGTSAAYVIPAALVVDHLAMTTGLLERAAAHGVSRVVLLSARGVDTSDEIPMRRAELALFATSGLDATVVRPTWFAQNFTEGAFAAGVAEGVLAVPAGDGREPFVDADDIAAVVAALLLDRTGRWAGQAIDLSGGKAYTFGEAADVLTAMLGHPVRHVDVTSDDFVAGAVAAGLPADYAGLLAGLFDGIRNGHDAHLSHGVERVLGRPARSLEQWAADSVGVA